MQEVDQMAHEKAQSEQTPGAKKQSKRQNPALRLLRTIVKESFQGDPRFSTLSLDQKCAAVAIGLEWTPKKIYTTLGIVRRTYYNWLKLEPLQRLVVLYKSKDEGPPPTAEELSLEDEGIGVMRALMRNASVSAQTRAFCAQAVVKYSLDRKGSEKKDNAIRSLIENIQTLEDIGEDELGLVEKELEEMV